MAALANAVFVPTGEEGAADALEYKMPSNAKVTFG